jgi:anti-anti-sigma factor
MEFEAQVSDDDAIRLVGDFDLASVAAFEEATRAAVDGQREIVLDLKELRFIDSSGIRAILNLATALDGKGVVLRGPQPSVRKLIRLTGVEGHSGIRTED